MGGPSKTGGAGSMRGRGKPVSRGDMRMVAWVAGAIFVLDQALKYLVVHMMQLDVKRSIDVLPPWLNLRMARNQGVNFGREIKTIDHYGLFLKNPVLVGAGEGVDLHFTDRRNDHEVELSLIIGRTAKNVSYENALEYVAAYSIGLDMTVRGTEERSLRKAIDSYSVLGPWLVTADEIADPDRLDFSIHVGTEERQHSNTDKLIFDCRRLIEYGSQFYTLYPGDVIMTGTPEGVGPVVPGDVMHCYCEGIGRMDVAVRSA